MSTPGRRPTAAALAQRQLMPRDQVLSPSREPAYTENRMPTERYPDRHAGRVARDWTDDHGVGYGHPDLARTLGDLHAWMVTIVLWKHEFAKAVDKYGLPEGSSGLTSPHSTG